MTLRVRVDTVLDGFLQEQQRMWTGQDRRPVWEALREFVLNGGKRMRPAFCYWGFQGVRRDGKPPDDTAIVAGAALELFHCFALIHDDIIDGSGQRRGALSMHERFAAHHAQQRRRGRWQGDPAHFGRSVALLCGDLCASWAQQLFCRCGAAPEALRRAHELFATARSEAIAGEHLDVLSYAVNGKGGKRAVARAMLVARLKTARYSITRPLQIGAALAGGDTRLLRGYAAAGDALGEAFQLRDDLLGVFGDPDRTGKPVLDDLRQGKPTVLLALTLAQADRGQLEVLRSLVGNPDLDNTGAETVRTIMADCGALEAIESRIRLGHGLAVKALESLDLEVQARAELIRLADLAADRAH
ncbi:polyprenyl synthetase family protein [Allorhizocola rhizosphaerae]|uniref:polyprenyl synthetase family protein n=1 Tax=Allorhizocola rhizosphaerae TaxID=1872709 RepID=UPI000E3D0EB6|nr:polyprenyl synthetase family protein [Allorhizocola rhizosphaerae]